MKKLSLLLLILILSLQCYSQILFESGYFIDNMDQRIDCLIKNVDWRNNPNRFEYKLTESGETKKATLETVKEFGVDHILKYVRSTVNIDRSSENANRLSDVRNPVFNEENVFLKVLIEGQSTLYEFTDGDLNKYFYKVDDAEIQPLIYKKYLTPDYKIGENNQFRQQLWNDLKCSSFNNSTVDNLRYKKRELVNFFKRYHKCNDSNYRKYKPKDKRDLFNLNIRPRLQRSSLMLEKYNSINRVIDLDEKVIFGLGIEAEFILPFRKNKWAFTLEPTYAKYKKEKLIDANIVFNYVSRSSLITNIDYQSIEFPVGLRHYFFLNNTSKLFANIAYYFNYSTNSSILFSRIDDSKIRSYDIIPERNWALGIGYKTNDRYSIEIRYQTDREILGIGLWKTRFKSLSIIAGYSLF